MSLGDVEISFCRSGNRTRNLVYYAMIARRYAVVIPAAIESKFLQCQIIATVEFLLTLFQVVRELLLLIREGLIELVDLIILTAAREFRAAYRADKRHVILQTLLISGIHLTAIRVIQTGFQKITAGGHSVACPKYRIRLSRDGCRRQPVQKILRVRRGGIQEVLIAGDERVEVWRATSGRGWTGCDGIGLKK